MTAAERYRARQVRKIENAKFRAHRDAVLKSAEQNRRVRGQAELDEWEYIVNTYQVLGRGVV